MGVGGGGGAVVVGVGVGVGVPRVHGTYVPPLSPVQWLTPDKLWLFNVLSKEGCHPRAKTLIESGSKTLSFLWLKTINISSDTHHFATFRIQVAPLFVSLRARS